MWCINKNTKTKHRVPSAWMRLDTMLHTAAEVALLGGNVLQAYATLRCAAYGAQGDANPKSRLALS
eukprot:1228438-Amphidinium_carterae.2